MRRTIKALLTVVAMLLGMGCVPTSLTYPQQFDFPLRAAPKVPVLVAVQDQRPNSLKRQTMDAAAGMFRGDMGIPVYLFSTTGRPVADDLAAAFSSNQKHRKVLFFFRRPGNLCSRSKKTISSMSREQKKRLSGNSGIPSNGTGNS